MKPHEESAPKIAALERAVRKVNRGLWLREALVWLAVRDPLREFKYSRERGSPVLEELLHVYARTDEAGRRRIRELWGRCRSFRENVPVARPPADAESFRLHLLRFSVDYHCQDWRESILTLHEACAAAARAGVEMRPLLEQVADLSSAEDPATGHSAREELLAMAGKGF